MAKDKLEDQEKENKFRLVCHGCTNDALLSTNNMSGIVVTCQHCGLEQVAKEENYIVL